MDRHRRPLTGRLGRAARVALPLAFLGVFFAWPLGAIIGRAVSGAALLDVLGDPALRRVIAFTALQAVASTALTLAVGLPLAGVIARYRFPGRSALRVLVTVPFVLPTVVVGTAFLTVLRPGGPLAFLGWQRGIGPLLLAHVFFNLAVVVRVVGGFWATLDPTREAAARTLGASRLRTFTGVTLPALAPAVITAAAIVACFTFTSFGAVLILSDVAHTTIETEIARQVFRFADLPVAAALAVIQVVAIGAVLAVAARAQERRAGRRSRVTAEAAGQRPRSVRERVLVAAVAGPAAVFVAVPLAVLVLRSLRPGGEWSLTAYRGLGRVAPGPLHVSPLHTIGTSLAFALVATGIAVVVGGTAAVAIAARGGRATRLVDVLVTLPLGTSAVTVGLGMLFAFSGGLLDVAADAWIVPVAQAVVAVPFVVRTVLPALRSVDPRLRDAAAVLGASPRRVWREVDLPVTARAAAVAAAFAAAISLGEFGATLFVARPDAVTMPLAIERLLSRPGGAAAGSAFALATVLMVITAALVLVVDRVRLPGGEA
ncbi:MAG: ABC transporter permease [Actinomycetota bacterium]